MGRRGELRIMWLSSEGRRAPGRFLRAKGRVECLRIRGGRCGRDKDEESMPVPRCGMTCATAMCHGGQLGMTQAEASDSDP